MRRLLPDPQTDAVDLGQLLTGLALADRAPRKRPYTLANFITSADGHATVDGRSSALGDAGDKAVFRALRGCCDAILAGTGTLGAEHYGRIVTQPETVTLRSRLGLAAQPLACTMTRSGLLPADVPLLNDPESRVIVYSGSEIDVSGLDAMIEVVRIEPARLTITAMLEDLRERHGVRVLLCEGGPTLLGEMVSERVLDELYLTFAPKLVGGDGPAVTRGLQLSEPLSLELLWLLEQDNSMFARYGLNEPA